MLEKDAEDSKRLLRACTHVTRVLPSYVIYGTDIGVHVCMVLQVVGSRLACTAAAAAIVALPMYS